MLVYKLLALYEYTTTEDECDWHFVDLLYWKSIQARLVPSEMLQRLTQRKTFSPIISCGII